MTHHPFLTILSAAFHPKCSLFVSDRLVSIEHYLLLWRSRRPSPLAPVYSLSYACRRIDPKPTVTDYQPRCRSSRIKLQRWVLGFCSFPRVGYSRLAGYMVSRAWSRKAVSTLLPSSREIFTFCPLELGLERTLESRWCPRNSCRTRQSSMNQRTHTTWLKQTRGVNSVVRLYVPILFTYLDPESDRTALTCRDRFHLD